MTGQRIHTTGILVVSAAILLSIFNDEARRWEPLLWSMMTISVGLIVVGLVVRRRDRQQADMVQIPS